ncbi:MAG: hypothetical protein LUD72_10905 [Bacteroidales bacterium]|nr:hypothetical protein [Bacteroidales bacterium]
MTFRTLLVIGEKHKEIAEKYSLDTKVEPYVKFRLDDAGEYRQKRLAAIESILNSKAIPLSEKQKDIYKDLYLEIREMDDFEYYQTITNGCTYDETNGDALSTENPLAQYKYERCPQTVLEARGEESDFSNPFWLKDGYIAYSAKKGDINWDRMHLYNTEVYEKAWAICVDGVEPTDDEGRRIKEMMGNKREYFDNFANIEEYVRHSCSFWTYGVATEEKYEGIDYTVSDKEWVANFFERFIEPLSDDTLLSLYEVRALE